MAKMWAGRTDGDVYKIADELNRSISVDSRMYEEDIKGSIAHAKMLAKKNIITAKEMNEIVGGLESILSDINSGKLKIDMEAEDIHMFIEEQLTKMIGDSGKKLHTARSRNDQVALDMRLYLLKETDEIIEKTKTLINTIVEQAKKNIDCIMPGYTHLQRAQPVLFSHYIMSYSMMLLRDIDRLKDSKKRCGVSPIGACALAGTTYDTDRFYEAKLLGLAEVSRNSIDSVSDRDFEIEFLSNGAMLMMHLSRMAEELIMWSSWEFKFIEFSDSFTTGSSIMPQKKNPDMAELIRGKTGRVYGNLMALLTTLKGLPLAYNKDMQEDKEDFFDSIDTIKICLDCMSPMIESMTVFKENMMNAARRGFINATDLADYLVGKGMPFRTAYKISGTIVADSIKKGVTLEEIDIESYKTYSDLFDNGVYEAIDLKNCVDRRNSYGGTSKKNVEMEIEYVKGELEK